MNQQHLIEEIPKYKNGSKAIPKDDIVVQYSAIKNLVNKAYSLGKQEVIELVEGYKDGLIREYTDGNTRNVEILLNGLHEKVRSFKNNLDATHD